MTLGSILLVTVGPLEGPAEGIAEGLPDGPFEAFSLGRLEGDILTLGP